MKEVYKAVLNEEFKERMKFQREDIKQVKESLDKANTELGNAQKLLLNNEIEPSEYRSIKSDYERKISAFESRIIELSKQTNNIEPLLNKDISTLSFLDTLYQNADNKSKREIIGSIHPENSIFEECLIDHRVAKAVALISRMDNGFNENKNGQTGFFSICPLWLPDLDSNQD